MLLTEYNEAEQMELFKEDGRREGKEEGKREGRREGRKEGKREGAIETLISLVRKGRLSVKDAAEQAGITEIDFLEKLHDDF